MGEIVILCAWGPFTLTAYGLCLALGAALGAGLTVWRGRKTPGVDRSLSLCLAVLLSAWAGARLIYVLTQLESIFVDAAYYGWPFILQPWEGGYTLYGAVLGGGLGAWAYAKAARQPAGALLDRLVPGAALTLCLARLGEAFTSQGLGHYVDDPAWQRLPFAVESLYGDFQQPVFLWEAAAALVICLALLRYRPRRAGAAAEAFLVLLGVTQIFLESHREDEFIRFGFVRFTQLAAVAGIAWGMGWRLYHRARQGGWRWPLTVRTAVFALTVGLCVAIEFALDKSSVDNRLLYLIMAAGLGAMGWAALPPSAERP